MITYLNTSEYCQKIGKTKRTISVWIKMGKSLPGVLNLYIRDGMYLFHYDPEFKGKPFISPVRLKTRVDMEAKKKAIKEIERRKLERMLKDATGRYPIYTIFEYAQTIKRLSERDVLYRIRNKYPLPGVVKIFKSEKYYLLLAPLYDLSMAKDWEFILPEDNKKEREEKSEEQAFIDQYKKMINVIGKAKKYKPESTDSQNLEND